MSELQITDFDSLEDAFMKFRDASSRLQVKYDMLLKETAELREELERRSASAAESGNESVLGNLAAAMAHEIRNPLGSMKLFLSLLRDDCQGSSSQLELVENIGNSMSNVEQVIESMLQLTSNKLQNFAPMNLEGLVLEQIAQFRMLFPKLSFEFSKSGENFFLLGHEQSLRQVVANLLRNASEAVAEDSGKVHVTLNKDKVVSLVVQDNGGGIPEETRSRIFEPFVSSKNQGTGLGLAIAKRILLKHGANITAENIEGGARFEVVFSGMIRKEIVE